MLARLILALLLAAFAFPAAAPAACHESKAGAHAMAMPGAVPGAVPGAMPGAMPDAMEHSVPVREREATPPHGCIGCVPPSTWIAARAAIVGSQGGMVPVARVVTLDIGTGVPPALPPPRTA